MSLGRILTGLAVAGAIAHALWSAWDQGWTTDERVHLEWSRRLLEEGGDERASVSRFNTKTPVMLAHVSIERTAQALGVTSERGLRFAARLPSVAALAALLCVTFRLGGRLFGLRVARIATVACALDPNLVAHGSLATVDVPYALAVLLVAWAGLELWRRPSPARGILLGASLGLAFSAKFSAVLLLPSLALLPLAGLRPPPGTGRRLAGGVALAVAVAGLVVSSSYLFVNVAPRLGDLDLASGPLQAAAQACPWLRVPVPAAFLTGIDRSIADERGTWNVYLLGTFHPRGVWYYFLVLWFLKTPLLVWVGQVAGLAWAWRTRALQSSPDARFLALVLLLHLAYFSFAFHAQIGYRFVLMCVPLGYLLAAVGLAQVRSSRGIRVAAAAILALAASENVAYLGNPLAFTNAAVWPKRDVYRLIADSNVDWGQDRERIPRLLARAGAVHTSLDPLHVLPGHNTIRLNDLVGVTGGERHRWLRENLRPAGHFGHTYLWFDVDPAAYDRFLDEARRFEPSAAAQELCGGPEPPLYPPGSRVPLSLAQPAGRTDTWLVCASVRKTTDLALKATSGGVILGRYDAGVGCQGIEIIGGQTLWSRLATGSHALCLEEIPNRRAWLPYRFEGAWLVRGHGVRLELRRAQGTHTSTSGTDQPSKLVPPSSTSSESPVTSRP